MTLFDPNTDPFYAAVTGGRLLAERFDVAHRCEGPFLADDDRV